MLPALTYCAAAYSHVMSVVGSAQDERWVAEDWEQCVVQLAQKLLYTAVVYGGEGRWPHGGVNNSCIAGDARPPVERPDASNYITGVGPLETPNTLC